MKSLIKYEGIKISNKIGVISFSNEKNEKIDIPISEFDARRIALYLDKLTTVDRKIVERNNDEKSE